MMNPEADTEEATEMQAFTILSRQSNIVLNRNRIRDHDAFLVEMQHEDGRWGRLVFVSLVNIAIQTPLSTRGFHNGEVDDTRGERATILSSADRCAF